MPPLRAGPAAARVPAAPGAAAVPEGLRRSGPLLAAPSISCAAPPSPAPDCRLSEPSVPPRSLPCSPASPARFPALPFPRSPLGSLSPPSCALPAVFPHLCSTSAVPVPGRSDEDPSRRPSPTCGPELKVTAVIPYALSPYLPHSFYFTAFIFWGTLCRTKPSLLCSASARAVLLRPHPSPFSVSSHAELPGRPDRSARTAFPARSRGAAAGPCRAVGPAGGRGRPALSAGLCCAGGAALSLRERWRKAVRVGVLQDFGAPPPSSRSVPAPGERDPKAALPAALREGIGTGKRREGNFGRLRAAEPAV